MLFKSLSKSVPQPPFAFSGFHECSRLRYMICCFIPYIPVGVGQYVFTIHKYFCVKRFFTFVSSLFIFNLLPLSVCCLVFQFCFSQILASEILFVIMPSLVPCKWPYQFSCLSSMIVSIGVIFNWLLITLFLILPLLVLFSIVLRARMASILIMFC